MPTEDGLPLEVEVRGVEISDVRQPVVVFPASWGASTGDFELLLQRLAQSGYLTVGYTPRGFRSSGGRVEGASAADVRDFSAVIDWIAKTYPSVSCDAIGAVGLSYGAGISLLAAARDSRISTVVAVDGWADLYAALARGDTARVGSLILGLGLLAGRPRDSLLAAVARFCTGFQPERFRAWADERSVVFEADELSRRQTSVLLAAGLNDTVLRPEQMVDFHRQLKCRTVLLLHADEHPVLPMRQLTTRSGREVWRYVRRWLDAELKGLPTGTQDDHIVILRGDRTENDRGTRPGETTPLRLGLGAPSLAAPGRLAGRGGAWSSRLLGGLPSGATDRMPLLSDLLQRTLRVPPSIFFPLVPAIAARTWTTSPFDATLRLRGSPLLHGTVSCAANRVTVTAHLYAVRPPGLGVLLSQGAVTLVAGGEGPIPFDITMRTCVAEVPAGHRLGLILGTWDPTCLGRTPPLRPVTLRSMEEDPSVLTVPVDHCEPREHRRDHACSSAVEA
ncbi:CocE/NonD family hydrolase [Streptomyces sp. NPDC002779]|uniref:CocE/NonD family hydrolase n=1 Tax=Streptomyces sp. NPDC002779 TaxID=3364664 RepID=UPI00368C0BD0